MASPFRRPRNYRRTGDDQVTTTLIGRRVAMHALVAADFPSWQEVRRRNAAWLIPWEPARTPGLPDVAESAEAFAMRVLGPRASEAARHRSSGSGSSWRPVRRRDQPVVRAAGAVPVLLRGLLDRRGPGGQRLHARSPRAHRPLRLRRAPPPPHPISIIPATTAAGGWSRSSRSATRASPCGTWRSTGCGRPRPLRHHRRGVGRPARRAGGRVARMNRWRRAAHPRAGRRRCGGAVARRRPGVTSRDDGDVEPLPELPTTTVDAGGIEVAAPDRWQEVPVPQLGFGVAIPPGWEATVLDPEVLATWSARRRRCPASSTPPTPPCRRARCSTAPVRMSRTA